MEVIRCPHCNTRMVPTPNGICVSCSRSIHEPRQSAFSDEPEQDFGTQSYAITFMLVVGGTLSSLFGMFQIVQLFAGVSGLRIALIGISVVVAIACFLNARST